MTSVQISVTMQKLYNSEKGVLLKARQCNGVHPCAFCLAKNTLPCSACAERYEQAVLEEDISDKFLFERDTAYTSLSGNIPLAH